MSLVILFHVLCAQHVSDINISIIRSLRLFCWITTLVVLFLVLCVLEIQCGWVVVVSVLQDEASAECSRHCTKVPKIISYKNSEISNFLEYPPVLPHKPSCPKQSLHVCSNVKSALTHNSHCFTWRKRLGIPCLGSFVFRTCLITVAYR